MKAKCICRFSLIALTFGISLAGGFCEAISHKSGVEHMLTKINQKEKRLHVKTVHAALDTINGDISSKQDFLAYEMSRKEKPTTNVMVSDYGKYSVGLGKGCPTCSKHNSSSEKPSPSSCSLPVLFIRGAHEFGPIKAA